MDTGDALWRLFLQPGWSVLVNNAGRESAEPTVVLVLRLIVTGRTIWVQRSEHGFLGMVLTEPAPLRVDASFVVSSADEMLFEVHKIVHRDGAAFQWARERNWCIAIPAGWHVKNNLAPDEKLNETTAIALFDELMVFQHLMYEVEVDIGATSNQTVGIGVVQAPAWEEREVTVAANLAEAIPVAERLMRTPFLTDPPLRVAPPSKKRRERS